MSRPDGEPKAHEPAKAKKGNLLGGFALVFRSRYLTLIAVLLVLLNLVNSTGEFLLSSFAEDSAEAALAATQETTPNVDAHAFVSRYLGLFYGDFFFWVNIVGGRVAGPGSISHRQVSRCGWTPLRPADRRAR